MKKIVLLVCSLSFALLLTGCGFNSSCSDTMGSYTDSCCGTNSYVGAWY